MVFRNRDARKDFYKTFLSIPSTYWSYGDATYVPILLVNQGCRVQFNKVINNKIIIKNIYIAPILFSAKRNKGPNKRFLELKPFNNNSRI